MQTHEHREPGLVQMLVLIVMTVALVALLPIGIFYAVGRGVVGDDRVDVLEPVMVLCSGVGAVAAALSFIGSALLPSWRRAWLEPPPGPRAGGGIGRLTALGFGLWFGGGGLAVLGHQWMTEGAAWAFIGVIASATASMLIGITCDRRRTAEAQRGAVESSAAATPSRRRSYSTLGSGRELGRIVRRN
jgi:hypothetical protein